MLTAAPAPVAIHSCVLSRTRAGSVVWLAFMDRPSVAATLVRITVRGGDGTDATVIDRGTFAPDVEVEHALRPRGERRAASHGRPSCSVAYVRFADGSEWTP
jgi:hypothetical protein